MSDRTPQEPPPASSPGSADPPAPAEASAASAEDAAARAEKAATDAARDRAESFALAEAAREAATKAGRFSREFFVTVISVVTTAFGVVVALAWNSALTNLLSQFNENQETIALFIYALLITFLAVLAIVIMTRVAKRIGAAPMEFKLEAQKKE